MANAKVVGVTGDRQFNFPPEILKTLNPGDEYLVWQNEDTILLKRIAQPISLDVLFQRIEENGADPEQPSEAEICQIVKEIRHKRVQNENRA
ncbi:MAG: hypothetical protein ACFBSF_14925 [Leptolyngbyaceae cyanobacterium]